VEKLVEKIQKRWAFKEPDETVVAEIATGLGVSEVCARVMVNRGIRSAVQGSKFFNPDLMDLNNPFLLPDIHPAIARIKRALQDNEQIMVYGDRDVDGITSMAIMIRTLKALGASPLWYIPSDEGYGVHKSVVESFVPKGVKLVITVDCGTSGIEEVEFAKTLGIDFVITDHHEPPSGGLPRAAAIVNPKRADSNYPFLGLAGCSVSFKVCEALMLSFGKYFDKELVVIGMSGSELECLKARNGLVVDKLSRGSKDFYAELLEFAKTGRVVAFERETINTLNIELEKNLGRRLENNFLVLEEKLDDSMKAEPRPGPATSCAADTFKAFEKLENLADLRMSFFRTNLLDLVALGTIADIMPLLDENRIFVKKGLEQIVQTTRAGLRVLLERINLKKNGGGVLTAKNVSWNLTPLLNAAGRRGKAGIACELLLTDDSTRASDLVDQILKLNAERKELQAENMEKFLPLIEQQCDIEKDKILVAAIEGVEHGVTGIIASQIMRKYGKPTILLIIEGPEAMGAARSVEGFDIVACLENLKDILIKFGGHAQAAGLKLSVDKIEEFRSRLKKVAEETLTLELLAPTIEIDSAIEAKDISMKLINELLMLEPFGTGNPFPVFTLKNAKINEHTSFGTYDDHLRLKISKDNSQQFEAVGWGFGALDKDINENALVDLAVKLELNSWQNKKTIQLSIVDLKPSALTVD
jgi:single-stranded-DNA-specific exonuclease